jgi:hypothetical protein
MKSKGLLLELLIIETIIYGISHFLSKYQITPLVTVRYYGRVTV